MYSVVAPFQPHRSVVFRGEFIILSMRCLRFFPCGLNAEKIFPTLVWSVSITRLKAIHIDFCLFTNEFHSFTHVVTLRPLDSDLIGQRSWSSGRSHDVDPMLIHVHAHERGFFKELYLVVAQCLVSLHLHSIKSSLRIHSIIIWWRARCVYVLIEMIDCTVQDSVVVSVFSNSMANSYSVHIRFHWSDFHLHEMLVLDCLSNLIISAIYRNQID